jgi:hypothetical protein
LIGGAHEGAIPMIIRGWTYYHLTTFGLKDGDQGYESLYRLLTGNPKVIPPPIGKPLLEILERKTDFMRIIEVLQVPERNPFFTGRELVLAQLQEALADRGRAALSGLGGVGKTQTAIEYARRHLEEYDCILCVGAQSREAIVSGYAMIAGLLKLPEADSQDQMLAVEAV